MYNNNISTLIEGCKEIGISLTQKQLDQFTLYYELLTEKNKVMNLTAITKWEEVLTKHFLDSLLVVRTGYFPSDVANVLDMGTGAGFPGIPLKIVFPGLSFTLADSLNKRILFLDDVIEKLDLKDVRTVHARAEDLGKDPEYRERFETVVSRAVANLSSLSEYCLPLVKVGGSFISYKSTDIDIEVEDAGKAVRELGGEIRDIFRYPLPETDLERVFVMIDKVRKTPSRYPRKAGVPKKDPL